MTFEPFDIIHICNNLIFILGYIMFWVSSILTYSKGKSKMFPQILLCCTHKDKVSEVRVNIILSVIMVYAWNNSLTSSLFIEMSMPNKTCDRSCNCVRCIDYGVYTSRLTCACSLYLENLKKNQQCLLRTTLLYHNLPAKSNMARSSITGVTIYYTVVFHPGE